MNIHKNNTLFILSLMFSAGAMNAVAQVDIKSTVTKATAALTYDNLNSETLKLWDKKMAKDPTISAKNIGSLSNPNTNDINQIHRGLTLWLLGRLELLAEEKNKDVIKVSLEEVANRFYLLDRVVAANKLAKPGKSSIRKEEQDKAKALIDKIPVDGRLSVVADEVFQKNGLLEHEHVIYMLSIWMSESK